MRALLIALLALLLPTPLVAETHDYSVGQVWEYRTAPEDSGSLLKIQTIETIGPETDPSEVFHISLIGIDLAGDGSNVSDLQHLPVSRKTLDESVTRLSDSAAEFPDYHEGLAEWRRANGGVFTISVAEIADVIRVSFARVQARN